MMTAMMIAIVTMNKLDNNIDTYEYRDVEQIIGFDGFITPRATFLAVRENNQYMHNISHEEWAKIYVREVGLYDLFRDSGCQSEVEFLENKLQYIRFAYIDLVATSLMGRNPWNIYREYDNGNYNEDQIAFLKEVCQAYITTCNLEDNIREK